MANSIERDIVEQAKKCLGITENHDRVRPPQVNRLVELTLLSVAIDGTRS
jgi:hypothetical protein